MIQKAFWVEVEHAKAVKKLAKQRKVTESAIIREMIDYQKTLVPVSNRSKKVYEKDYWLK